MNSDFTCTTAYLREQIVGIDSFYETPFGSRILTYCDYTASGRCLKFIENYLMVLQQTYANTHTEDDVTGRNMSALLHQAENLIKQSVGAGEHGKIIACGYGATGAIDKFQQLIGVRLPPATRELLRKSMRRNGEQNLQTFRESLEKTQPVVFIGGYEHHSNEISWREGLSTVVRVELDADGTIDLERLEKAVSDERWKGRMKIGSFSAASNVTGLVTPIREIARILHEHDALACFDYAASAPYVQIDMQGEGIDAIFLSPHKFIGGPGATGLLIFNERLYDRTLPPSMSGGGTVSYVSAEAHDYIEDIEEREKAGTPGVLQTLKAALAFMIKDSITVPQIHAREQCFLTRAFDRWQKNGKIEIMGDPDPSKRVGIVSFNIRDDYGKYLHPKLVTVLLNDLFGIQSRAGCSCAGPYGHTLLGIDADTSERYRRIVARGWAGYKPGWCRVGFHYAMDDAETSYIIDAVDFLAEYGSRFLPLYTFEVETGAWHYRRYNEQHENFSLNEAFSRSCEVKGELSPHIRQRLYDAYLNEARKLAAELPTDGAQSFVHLDGEAEALRFFHWYEA